MPEIPRDRPTGDSHAPRDEQHIAKVTAPFQVGETLYQVGDLVTPKRARELKIPHVITTDRPQPETK